MSQWWETLPDWLAKAPTERKWLIKGWLPHKAITVMSGQQKATRKTFFAILLALVVANSKRWGPFLPGEHAGKVLFILEEGEASETAERIKAVSNGAGLPLSEHFLFAHRAGVSLDDEQWAADIRGAAVEQDVRLIVIDTLTSAKDCDENDASEMKLVMNTINNLTDDEKDTDYEGAGVLLIAHLAKGVKPGREEDPDNQIRGSSIVGNMRDTHIAQRNFVRSRVWDLDTHERGGEGGKYTIGWDMQNEISTDADGYKRRRLVTAVPVITDVGSEDTLMQLALRLPAEGSKTITDHARHMGVDEYSAKRAIESMLDLGMVEKKGRIILPIKGVDE